MRDISYRTIQQHGYTVDFYDNTLAALNKDANRVDEMLSFRAVENPDKVRFFLLDEEGEIEESATFQQMHDWACRIAGLVDRFMPERSRVVLCFENGTASVAGFFGCLYANMEPVSGVYPAMLGSADRLFEIVEDSGAVAVLGTRETLMGFRRQAAGRAAGLKWIPIEGAEQAKPLHRRHAAALDDIAYVQYTSGSTGHPRGVEITHRNVGANLQQMMLRGNLWAGESGLIWLPLSHDLGLVSVLYCIGAGGALWLMRPEHFIAKPERWVQAIDRYRLSFSAGPNFAYELLARQVPDAALEGLDLSCWAWSFIGAEMIEQDTVETLFKRYLPIGLKKSVLRPGYGMAETTLMVSSGKGDGKEVVSFDVVSRRALAEGRVAPPYDAYDKRAVANCGRVIDGHDILVVDPENEAPLPDGQVGELWFSGPSVTPGYVNREVENRERFIMGDDGRRWFRSRDMGFMQQGCLFVTGRLENSVPIGEQRYDPADLAQAVRQACPLFTSRAVAVFRHEGMLCVMGELSLTHIRQTEDYGAVLEAMARAMRHICPVKQIRCVLVRQGGIWRTPSGKMRLAATSEAYTQGRLPVVQEQSFGPESLEHLEVLAWGERPL